MAVGHDGDSRRRLRPAAHRARCARASRAPRARARGVARPRRRGSRPQARRDARRDPARARPDRVRRASQRTTVELDPHARTVDSLEERRPRDAVFVLGADELVAFPSGSRRSGSSSSSGLGVAMRPGTSPDAVRAVARRLGDPTRVLVVRARARPGLVVGDPRPRRARPVDRRPRPVAVSRTQSGASVSTRHLSRLGPSSTRMRERPT